MPPQTSIEYSLRRMPPRRPVRRVPTPEMRAANTHVGVVTWSSPWEESAGTPLVRWVVARYDGRSEATSYDEGHARGQYPEPQIVEAIGRMIADSGADIWVSVSKRRLALYRQLEASGIPTTSGGESNRAFEAAILRMQELVTASMRAQNVNSLTRSRPAPQGVPDSLGIRRPKWIPEVDIARPSRAPVVICCDGSFNATTGIAAFAAVSNRGDLRASIGMVSRSDDAELLAIMAAMELGGLSGAAAVTIMTDSLAAMGRLEALLSGEDEKEDSRWGTWLRSIRAAMSTAYVVRYVPSRQGNALHDAADAIAFSVRRASTMYRDQAETILLEIVNDIALSLRGQEEHEVQTYLHKSVIVAPHEGAVPPAARGCPGHNVGEVPLQRLSAVAVH